MLPLGNGFTLPADKEQKDFGKLYVEGANMFKVIKHIDDVLVTDSIFRSKMYLIQQIIRYSLATRFRMRMLLRM